MEIIITRPVGSAGRCEMQTMVTFFFPPSPPLLPVHLGCVVLQNTQQHAHSLTAHRPPSCRRRLTLRRPMAPERPGPRFPIISSAESRSSGLSWEAGVLFPKPDRLPPQGHTGTQQVFDNW